MPVITVYHHGVTAAIPPSKNDHERARRGEAQGWSKSATRSNMKFLRSINPKGLEGSQGFAFTLTVKDCPDSSDDWAKARNALLERFRRFGVIRFHWVTEWQRRGCPHLHGILYVDSSKASGVDAWLRRSWLEIAEKFGAQPNCQMIKPANDSTGWFKYMSKHAARGADHYQRSAACVPSGWLKTGRVWGHGGDWRLDEPFRIEADNDFFYSLRRIVRRWRIADARAEHKDASRIRTVNGWGNVGKNYASSKRRISSARRMLKCNKPKLSAVRGVSEWITADLVLQVAGLLIDNGKLIHVDEASLS